MGIHVRARLGRVLVDGGDVQRSLQPFDERAQVEGQGRRHHLRLPSHLVRFHRRPCNLFNWKNCQRCLDRRGCKFNLVINLIQLQFRSIQAF